MKGRSLSGISEITREENINKGEFLAILRTERAKLEKLLADVVETFRQTWDDLEACAELLTGEALAGRFDAFVCPLGF
jgi:hypothetical protein